MGLDAEQLMIENARLQKELQDVQARLNRIISIYPGFGDETEMAVNELLKGDNSSVEDTLRFTLLMDSLSNGVVFQDATGKIIRYNKAASRILGLTSDQIEGRTSVDPRWRAIHEDGSDFKGEDHPAMVALRTGQPVNDIVLGIMHPGEKTYVWIKATSTPIILKGKNEPDEVFTIFTDITRKINADNELMKYQSISDSARYGAIVLSDSGIIQYANNAMTEMFGWKVADLMSMNLFDLFHSDHHNLSVSILEILHKRGVLKAKEVMCLRNDGSTFPALITATVIYNELREAQNISATLIDISKQKKQEEIILEHYEKLSAIILAMPDKIFEMDREGNYLAGHTRNPVELFAPHDILIGKNMNDVFSKEVAELNLRSIRESLDGNALITHEYSYISNEKIYYYEVRTVPLSHDRVLRFVRDISDKRVRELEIRKLKLAIEQSPVMLVITDPQGRFEYVSPAFTKITGYSIDEVKGKHTRLLKSGFNKKELYEDLWSTIRSGKAWSGELHNRKKTGELYWEWAVITPIMDEAGIIINYLAIKEDITDRKRIEKEILDLNTNLEAKVRERTAELEASNRQLTTETEERKRIEEALRAKTDELEKFFSVSADMLCIANSDGTFLKVNRAFEDVLGYPTKYFENRNFIEFLHPDDQGPSFEKSSQMIDNEKVYGFINQYKHHDGGYRKIEWHVVKVDSKLYAAARDVTERILFEETLEKNIAREKELNELKSRFVSIASHEFRTPLSAILMASETLLNYWKRLDEEKLQSKLNAIINQVKHLNEIVSNVLQVSKIQEGKIALVPKEIELVGFILKAMEPFNPDSDRVNKINFESEFDHLDMLLDTQLMMQVLNNLFSNAIKYSQPDPRVCVRLYRKDGNVLLSVQDNGIGIPGKDLDKMFQPFFRAGNVANISGNGLGLNIVKEAVVLHGGNITVESKQGNGTTFYVELPDSLVIKG